MKRLNRATHGRPAAPVRIIHLGLGNFTRAHQAWYTEHCRDADQWGIAAFTGRRPTAAELLAPQDGLYTLVTKGADMDTFEVISSLSAVHPASDTSALLGYFAAPATAIVTSTVTEAGYRRRADGSLDVDATDVAADVADLRDQLAKEGASVESLSSCALASTPVRVAAGVLVRREADAGPLTVLPCDNLCDNGSAFRRVVLDALTQVAPDALDWVEANVSWASSMVDRITPATTDDDVAAVSALGYQDSSPVPTEPFAEWVISGDFPAGHPDWAGAGVTFVDDVAPYEERKLWMLNGAHSLLAYAGSALGCRTVAEAIVQPTLREWVEQWWQDAGACVSVPWEAYRQSLLERFTNPRVRHLLAQIAADGSVKIPVRCLPVLRARLAQGATPAGAVRLLAAWIAHLRGVGAPVKDVAAEQVTALVGGTVAEDVSSVLHFLAPDVAGEDRVVSLVVAACEEILQKAR
ncbi:mannitol dehydrogenase family protein [Schaalia sp. 19OD2882]|uniref:mannitol dehydrogenase family protein n=1 Tax=Schaalia sp. 19OD2882 TaxID=2794089 RepID=UPI001C1E9A7E|nr:mannitol dehydrogenase family protein [Schaalia sp. 19OD2882]QWW19984.1 mannitol dehydrogenase family protein [Schaalia sp. 19OD2882]